ncbi:MAG: hypothetical protein IJT11_04210, partial [Bacteroidaceae bacterium]|nr:hypothetical protein [Bacteroidaceae bacterium]
PSLYRHFTRWSFTPSMKGRSRWRSNYEMTLEEIGETFGLTRERVRQIREKAIRKLRAGSRNSLLRSYLG